MTLKIKFSIRLYRKLNVDIWNLTLLGWPETNINKHKRSGFFFQRLLSVWLKKKRTSQKRLVFRTDDINPEKRRRKVHLKFASLRIVKFFYLTLKYKHFKCLARDSRKKDGYFGHHYCLAVEGRLISFVYRTGFVSNMFEALNAVKTGFVSLNNEIINYPNHPTGLFKILSFHPVMKSNVYFDLYTRIIYDKRTIFPPSNFIFTSYWFLFAYMHSYPIEENFILPKTIDIYRASGFAT
jgi:ribosomal protein S4